MSNSFSSSSTAAWMEQITFVDGFTAAQFGIKLLIGFPSFASGDGSRHYQIVCQLDQSFMQRSAGLFQQYFYKLIRTIVARH